MESCRFVVLRSPGGRLGSVLTRAIAYAAHARALPSVDTYRANSPSQPSGQSPSPPSFGFSALWGAQALAYAVQATTHYQTYPERVQEPIYIRKSFNLDPMAPRSR